MAARAIWKGSICAGKVRLPIKVYSAVHDETVHFRLLSARDHRPVTQHMVDPVSEEVVEYADIRRGFEVGEEFVILQQSELKRLSPAASREITIQAFVARAALGAEWFVRPYFLAPDGARAEYFAFARALAEAEKIGVAHWVMRGTEYAGALCTQGDHLALITLRHAEEVLALSELPAPTGRSPSAKERNMARQLVETFSGPFEPATYRDAFRDQVRKLVEAKAKGHKLRLTRPRTKVGSSDLEAALGKSLKAAQATSKTSPRRKERQVA